MPGHDIAATGSARVYLSLNRPPILLGRFRTTSGRIVDTALDPGILPKAMSGTADTSLAGLVGTAQTLLTRGRPASDRPIAFVAIGFGSLSEVPWLPEWGKGNFDPTKHPRWPTGAPDSEGGRFRPNDAGDTLPLSAPTSSGSGVPGTGHSDGPPLNNPASRQELDQAGDKAVEEASRRAEKTAVRRAGRLGYMELFKAGLWGVSLSVIRRFSLILDVLDAVRAIKEMIEFAELHPDIIAADQFLRNGPYTVDDLRMGGGENIRFRNFRQFTKFDETELEKKYGPAGDGWEYHHIVMQNGANGADIPQEQLNSTENIVRIPRIVHEMITAKYNSQISSLDLPSMGLGDLKIADPSMLFRDWLQTQPYEVQLRIGIQVMRSLYIVK